MELTKRASGNGPSVSPVRARSEQAVAAATQLLVLAGLAVGVGLGPLGMLAGVLYGAALLGLLAMAMDRAGRHALGPADVVTLARALLVGGVTALVVDDLSGGLVTGGIAQGGVLSGGDAVAATPALVTLAAVALALDMVDGYVARRTGTTSALGARFDMEVDAFLILVLCVHVVDVVGSWVLATGLLRYAFVAAGWAWPWLRGSLPVSYVAKAVAALQGVVLVVVSTEALPGPAASVLVAAALILLCWSFARSIQLLWRAGGRGHTAPVSGPLPIPEQRTAS